jgi:hypothetical protein
MRGHMWSPGRPSTARREDRVRFWQSIARGLSTEEAALEAGVSIPVGTRWFRHAGGMPPIKLLPTSRRYLSLSEREEIAILYAQQLGIREIARRIGRSPSTSHVSFAVTIAAHCEGCSCSCSNTSRTARSRISGGYLRGFGMAPSSQHQEPPPNPGRFALRGPASRHRCPRSPCACLARGRESSPCNPEFVGTQIDHPLEITTSAPVRLEREVLDQAFAKLLPSDALRRPDTAYAFPPEYRAA